MVKDDVSRNKTGRQTPPPGKEKHMKIENLEKANEIQKRIMELEKAKAWMEEEGRNVYILAAGCTINESIKINSGGRALLYGLILGEHLRLQKEFEKL